MLLKHENLRVEVIGAATALPKVPSSSNFDLLNSHPETKGKPESFLREMADRIHKQYGFNERHLSHHPSEGVKAAASSESLITDAVKLALNGKKPSAFVLGSTTSRRYTGSQATAVLGRLEIEAPAFEVKAGCSTSLASLQLAQALLLQGYPDVLVACGETLSKLINPKVRETWFGLADGAAAVWFRRAEAASQITFERIFYSTDGRAVDLFTTKGELPPVAEAIEAGEFYLEGDGQELMRQAVLRYSQMIDAINPSPTNRWIIPHQVNRKLINEIIEQKKVRGEVVWDADKIGNIGGSSVLFSLANGLSKNRFNDSGEMLLMSVGGGLSFASQIWKWG